MSPSSEIKLVRGGGQRLSNVLRRALCTVALRVWFLACYQMLLNGKDHEKMR